MSRYADTNPNDQASAAEGDAAFVGVNAKMAPLLKPGWLQGAENLTFREARAETRRGLCTPVSHRWTAASGEHVVRGAAIFSDPNGLEWMLLATPHAVLQLRSGSTPRTIAVPEEITGRVEIVQAFSTVLIFRGADLTPWEWSGDAFQPVSQADLGDATRPIPNGSSRPNLRPVVLNDRLWVPHDRTSVAASELLDYTRNDPDFYDYNLAGGNDDQLTALFPFRDTSLLVFNDGSIQLLSGLSGDLSTAAKDPVNRDLGCIAPGSPAQMGGDVLFLSSTGVYRVQEVIQNKLETSPVPVSDAIEPLMRLRVNWRTAHLSVAAVLGDYYFLAVPIDGADAPNALLPYNATTGAWEGLHVFPEGVRFDSLLIAEHFGQRCLWGVDFASGLVHRLYAHFGSDRVLETVHAIPCQARGRGMLVGSNDTKKFHAAQVTLDTWAPSIGLQLATDGQQESTTLVSAWTRSRTKRLVHGLPAINPSNVNGDHAAPRREDYSVRCPFYVGAGIRLERRQTQPPLRYALRERGRHAALTVASTQGVISLTSLQIEGYPTDHHTHPAP